MVDNGCIKWTWLSVQMQLFLLQSNVIDINPDFPEQ
jgi:hypothetical protein